MDEFARGFDPEQALRAVTALPGPGSGAGDERAIPPLDEGDHGAVHAKLVGRMSHAGDTGDTNGTAEGLVVTSLGRECGRLVRYFKLDRRQLPEPALASFAVIASFYPLHHCQAQFLFRRPPVPVQHVLLQKREERL